MAIGFFRQNLSTLIWEYGSFKSDGITPSVEYAVPSGLYKCKWETINNQLLLTILNANNIGELSPIKRLPLSELASDLIGTPYTSRQAFELTTKNFFFGSSNSFYTEYGYIAFEISVVSGETNYSLPIDADITKDWIVSANGTSFLDEDGYTKLLVDVIPTISFSVAPSVSDVPVVWYRIATQTIDSTINRSIQCAGSVGVIDVSTEDYEPTINTPFFVKNDGDETVTLEVKYADGTDWIETKFKTGWREDLIKAVKTNANALDLKYRVSNIQIQGTLLNLIINWGFWSKDTESDYFTSLEDESPYYSLTEKE